MPSLEDLRLGQLAVAKGLCQPLEVEECLALQHKNEAAGTPEQLGELLIMRAYLTRTQLTRLLSIQQEAQQKVTRIGRYELLNKLGEGGMGAVYQAKDTRNNEIVALKVLPRSRARDKAFLQRFEQEARAAFELDHPNIVHGLDVDFADGYHFLVMEYVEGKDVYALLEQKGRLTESETLNILEQVAVALDHIHGEHLVHRDIKPENIIVTAEGQAKLADMGLVIDNEVQGRRRLTQAGIAMGTPFYLSPEQIEGKHEADIRSDIYSLAGTIYEMVTGRPPFDGETPAVVMMKHLNETVPSPHDLDRAISLPFCILLEKMMAKDPNLRYQTPAELLADIQRVKKGQPPLGTRPPVGKSSISRPEMHRDSVQMRPETTHENKASDAAFAGAAAGSAREAGSHSQIPAGTREIRGTQKYKPILASPASRARTGVQALLDTAQLRVAVFVGLAVAAAVLCYILIKIFGP